MRAVPRIHTSPFALVVAAIVLAGCSNAPDDGAEQASVPLEHVHGLGVDDGTLHAGTHHGVFQVTRNSTKGPVGSLEQDFMGFTVVGPGHFLASGHPGPGQDGPPNLGLLESTDRGQTWKTRSLSGEADCHALAHSKGTTYCMNSVTGELLASTDLKRWDVRSKEPVFDLAPSPNDPDKLIATTAQGLKSSEDGGRSFRLIAGAPALILIEWPADDALVGVDPNGRIVRRDPGKQNFAKTGSLSGQPEAFLATDAQTLYASVDGTIWRSGDGGREFSRLGGKPE